MKNILFLALFAFIFAAIPSEAFATPSPTRVLFYCQSHASETTLQEVLLQEPDFTFDGYYPESSSDFHGLSHWNYEYLSDGLPADILDSLRSACPDISDADIAHFQNQIVRYGDDVTHENRADLSDLYLVKNDPTWSTKIIKANIRVLERADFFGEPFGYVLKYHGRVLTVTDEWISVHHSGQNIFARIVNFTVELIVNLTVSLF